MGTRATRQMGVFELPEGLRRAAAHSLALFVWRNGTDPAAAAGTFGTIVAVGAASSLLAPPILGPLNDRTPSRLLGRRNVWVAGSSVLGVVCLLALAQLTSPLAIGIARPLVMWPRNGMHMALTTVLPGRVPVRQRGSTPGLVARLLSSVSSPESPSAG